MLIIIGRYKVSIPPSDNVFKTDYVDITEGSGDFICVSAFGKLRFNDQNLVILSYPFLYNVYTLFDYKQKRIGFAN